MTVREVLVAACVGGGMLTAGLGMAGAPVWVRVACACITTALFCMVLAGVGSGRSR